MAKATETVSNMIVTRTVVRELLRLCELDVFTVGRFDVTSVKGDNGLLIFSILLSLAVRILFSRTSECALLTDGLVRSSLLLACKRSNDLRQRARAPLLWVPFFLPCGILSVEAANAVAVEDPTASFEIADVRLSYLTATTASAASDWDGVSISESSSTEFRSLFRVERADDIEFILLTVFRNWSFVQSFLTIIEYKTANTAMHTIVSNINAK